MLIAMVLSSLMSSTTWARGEAVVATAYTTPTKKLAVADYPMFSDDLSLDGFELAAQRQLDLYNTQTLDGTIEMGGTKYPLSKAKASLEVFLQLTATYKLCLKSSSVAKCADTLNDQVRAKFNIFAPDLVKGDPRYGDAKGDSLFTGYATQPVTAASKPDDTNSHAIYAYPKTAADQAKQRGDIDFHVEL